MKYVSVTAASILAALLAGCGGPSENGLTVKEADYGDKWPLTVAEAKIGCDNTKDGKRIGYLEANGKRYALNGDAIRSGLPTLEEIQRDKNGMPIMHTDFIEKSMELCAKSRT